MPKKVNAFAKYMFDLKGSYPDLPMAEVQLIAGENWQVNNKLSKSSTNFKEKTINFPENESGRSRSIHEW